MENNDIVLEKYKIFGFLYVCLLRSAVTENELRLTMEKLVADCEDIEFLEMYADILEYDGSRLDLLRNFENINHYKWYAPLSKEQDDALIGIAYQRGNRSTDETYDEKYKQNGINALEKHPEVLRLFRKFFPFINF